MTFNQFHSVADQSVGNTKITSSTIYH